ncbi:MAG: hypothetical protein B6D56_02025 [Candidatus Omnitrophica bacterium 4484_70.1]|nr:MAG: hypothetical protein B6D56_02025 [Candidatus Omnitrophica bacterium 4484_70.1]
MLKRLEAILKLLEGIKVPVGKTFIQKGIYFLQEGLKENLGYKFRLYIYGPYSNDLAGDIDTLEDIGLIKVNYAPEGYGYLIKITPEGEDFLNKKLRKHSVPEEKIDKIINLLGGKAVKKMELLGTLLYFSRLSNNLQEIKQLVNIVKPRFSYNDIENGFNQLKKEEVIT